jgi:hypothetical protein
MTTTDNPAPTRTRRRVPDPYPFDRFGATRLLPEDWWLLDMLAEHRALTTEQIIDLGYAPSARARRRLRLLAQRLVVAPFTVHLDVAPTRPLRCWSLGTNGTAIAVARHGGPHPRSATVTARRYELHTNPRTAQLVAANGFFTNLAAHVHTHDDCDLRTWWSPRTCRPITTSFVRSARYGGYFDRGRWIGFWYVYDPEPIPPSRLRTQLDRYQRLGRTTGVTNLLWWFTDPDREQRQHERLHGQDLGQLTLATGRHDLGNPAEAIWRVVGTSDRVGLADLPPTPRLDHPHDDVWWDPGDRPLVTPTPPHPIWDPGRPYDDALIEKWEFRFDRGSEPDDIPV